MCWHVPNWGEQSLSESMTSISHGSMVSGGPMSSR
jgi:hypothetical protein